MNGHMHTLRDHADAAPVIMRRQVQGFTLIELLVSIGVIAVILSISVPALRGAIETGRSAVCLANLHSFGAALTMYMGEHKDLLPFADLGYDVVVGWEEPVKALGPYLDAPLPRFDEHRLEVVTAAPFVCPTDPGVSEEFGWSYSYTPRDGMAAGGVEGLKLITRLYSDRQASGLPKSPLHPVIADYSIWHGAGALFGLGARNGVWIDGSARRWQRSEDPMVRNLGR